MVNAERLPLDEADTHRPADGGGAMTGWPDLPGRRWRCTDILSQGAFERDGAELASPGLFVDLGPWQFHLLAVR